MADIKITDLVDEKVFEDLNRLSEDIKTLKQQYIETAKELAHGLNMKISTSGDLEKFNNAVAESGKKAQAVTEQLNAAIDRQRTIVSQTTNTISRELAEIEKENKAKREAFEQDKSAIDIAERLLGSRQNNILRLADLQTKLKEAKEAEKELDMAVKSGTVSDQAALAKRASLIDQQREYKAAIKDLNLVLNNQEKQMQASDGSYQKLSLQLEFLKKAYKGLSDEEKNGELGKRLGEEIGNLDAHLKDLAADMGEFQRNTGNYAIANQSVKTELRELVQEIATLTLQYRSMSDEERNSAQGQELEQKMNSMKARASELKDAVADVNREIAAGANDTKNFSAITEGINLLVSGVGGLTAASHALGIGEKDLIKIQANLQASLAASNALTKAQNALQAESNLMKGVARVQEMAHAAAIRIKTAAEGEGIIATKAATVAQAAFNAVAKANPYVLLATGIGLLVAAVVGFTKATKSETEEQKKAREEMEKSRKEYEEMLDVTKRLQEAREKGIESCADEIAKLEVLYSVATNVTRSLEERRKAVKKLQELYPGYLNNISEEAILNGKAADEVDRLRRALVDKAIAEAKMDKVKEYAKLHEMSETRMKEAKKELEFLKVVFGEEESLTREHVRQVSTIEDATIEERNIKLDKSNKERREKLQKDIEDAKKNMEDYRKSMEEIVRTVDINALYPTLDNTKNTSTSTPDKKETAKTYEEIKEIILESTQEVLVERIKMTEEGSKEEYDLTLKYIEAEKQLRLIELKKRFDEERKSLDENFASEKAALGDNYEAQKALQERYDADIKDLENNHRSQQINAERAALEAKKNAMKKYTDAYISSMQEAYAEEQKVRDLSLVREVTAITEARAQQLITEEEYQQQLAEKKMQYAVQTAEKEIEMLEKVLEAEELTADKRKEVAEKLAEAKADLAKEVADAELKNTKKTEKQEDAAAKKREKNLKQYLRSATQMLGKINGLVSAIYDGQIKKIEEEQEEAEKAHDAEIERIENLEETGAISKEEAEARKRAADERSAQKQEELEKKKQDLKYKQAVWDKATSIAQAGIATALAITEALPNIVLAAIVGAMGAIEIATIIATPIATYAKGTKDKDGHPGGLAIVGDAGKSEAVVFDNKMWITPDKPTIVDMPKGAIVYPDADNIPSPVLMTVMPTDSKDSPIVIVSHDSKKLERGVAQTNMLIKQSILMQKKIAYDAAFAHYKATRL